MTFLICYELFYESQGMWYKYISISTSII